MSELLVSLEDCSRLIATIGDNIVADLGTDFVLVGIVTGGAQCAKLMQSYILSKYGKILSQKENERNAQKNKKM